MLDARPKECGLSIIKKCEKVFTAASEKFEATRKQASHDQPSEGQNS
jgi:hypothetical protein